MVDVVNIHRKVSIDLLYALPCFAVRTPPGQKDPGHYNWDPKTNSAEKSQQILHKVSGNDDNFGVHLFGSVVDVDIDTDDPFMAQALEYFMPHTAHVWGRKSRPRTHRLYQIIDNIGVIFDPRDHRFLDAIAKREETKVEIRGGEQKAGRYSLLPGSVHPSGEQYEWTDLKAAQSSPVLIDVRTITQGLKFACVATLIAPHWNEGQRNALCQALSGFLHKAHTHSLALVEDTGIPFGMDHARSVLEGIMEISGDDEADHHMRIRTLEKTWEKAEGGAQVTGATRLKELTGDEDIISILYALLVDNPELQELDDFMARFALVKNSIEIIDIEEAGSKQAKYSMSNTTFVHSYQNLKLKTPLGKTHPMTRLLMSSDRAIRVDGLGFDPTQGNLYSTRGGDLVNMWRGMAISPSEEALKSDVEPFLGYIHDIVASGDRITYEWVMAWVADLFQNPGVKPGTALVLVGKPGAGKSILGDGFLRKIVGRDHSTQTNTVESLTGNFNSDSVSMLFIQCDEALNSRRRADAAKLKSMITDPTRRMERKGFDAVQVEDYARYLFTSNEHTDAIAILDGEDDRRYTVIEVSSKYCSSSTMVKDEEKRKYWDGLNAWVNDQENLAKLHRFLLSYVYNKNLIRKPLNTEARKVMSQHSQQGIDDWLMAIATFNHPFENLKNWGVGDCFVKKDSKWTSDVNGWPELVTLAVMVDSYKQHVRGRMVKHGAQDYNAQQLKKELLDRGLIATGKDGQHVIKVTRTTVVNDEIIRKRINLRCIEMFTQNRLDDFLEQRLGVTKDEGHGPVIELGTLATEKEEF